MTRPRRRRLGGVWQERLPARRRERSHPLDHRGAADQRGTDVEAIAAWGTVGAFAAWSGGQALVGFSGGIVARHGRRPPGYAVAAVSEGGHTWIAAGRRAISVAPDAEVLASVRVPAKVAGMSVDGGLVWVVSGPLRPAPARAHRGAFEPAGPGYAVAIDAATGRRVHRWTTGPGPWGVAVRGGALWVSTETGLDRLDAATGRVMVHVKAPASRLALGAGRLWSLDIRRGTLTRRDASTGLLDGSSLTRGALTGTLAADATGVWIGLHNPYRPSAVLRIDPATLKTVWKVAVPVT